MSSTNVPVTQAPPAAEPESSSPGSTMTSLTPADPGQDSAAGPVTAAADDRDVPPAGPDELAAAAVDLARQAAMEIAEPDTVGEHLGVTLDEGGLTMHSFRCTARGYRGWRWAVTLAHVPGSDRVTVCDTVLLPGADSIQAPAWVPWSDRLAPGDLGPGDDLPYRADDPLLVPGYTVTDEDDSDQQLFWELGLGRKRVVGLEGLQAAADRWQRGPHGPTSEIAVQASAACLSCAFLVPVSGFLRSHFGVCTNEWSPADGTVVTLDFGCGAHSETDLELPAPEPLPAHILDETIIEQVFVDRDEVAGAAEAVAAEAVEVAAVEVAEPVATAAEPALDGVDAGPDATEVEVALTEEPRAEAESSAEEPQAEVVEPQAEVVVEPQAEVAEEPQAEVVAEPQAEVAEEPQVEVAEEPQAEVVAEPQAQVAEEPQAEVVEPQVDVVAEPQAEVVAEPQAEVVEPQAEVAEVVAELQVEVAEEPQVELAAQPQVEVVAEPQAEQPPAEVIAESPAVLEPEADVVEVASERPEGDVETPVPADDAVEIAHQPGDDPAEVVEAVEPPTS